MQTLPLLEKLRIRDTADRVADWLVFANWQQRIFFKLFEKLRGLLVEIQHGELSIVKNLSEVFGLFRFVCFSWKLMNDGVEDVPDVRCRDLTACVQHSQYCFACLRIQMHLNHDV